MGPEWRPDRAKMVLSLDPVDPVTRAGRSGQANAWKRAPYHDQLRRWAASSLPLQR